MKKIVTTLILGISISFSATLEELTTPGEYVDFGSFGKEYQIKEKNIMKEIEEKAKAFSFDSKEVQDTIKKQVVEAAFEKTDKPLCLKDKKMAPEIDYATISEDIYNPLGRLIYSKGQKIKAPIKAGQKLDLCFVDSRILPVGQNQINTFLKEYPECTFLVANKNVLLLRKIYPDLKIFPTSQVQEDRFGVECYPATIHMEGETKEITYHSYDKFKN